MYYTFNYFLTTYKIKKFNREYESFKEKNDLNKITEICVNIVKERILPHKALKILKKNIKGNINMLPFYLLEDEGVATLYLGSIIEILIKNQKYKFNYLNNNNQNIMDCLLSTNFEYKNGVASEIISILSESNYMIDVNHKDYFGLSTIDYLFKNNVFDDKSILYSLLKIVPSIDSQEIRIRYNECAIEKLTNNQSINQLSNSQSPKINFSKKALKSDSFQILNDKVYLGIPAVGREEEFEQLILCLAQKKKNPLLVGESGVGKTALIDMLVYMIKKKKVPEFLKNKIIIEINPNDMVSGSKYRGDFEEKMNGILTKCVDNGFILFIDEIHLMYGSGSFAGGEANDMSTIIRSYMDKYDLKVIGTTTTDEYHKHFASSSLKRRFDIIEMKEPNNELLYNIVNQTLNNYSNQYNISIDEILTDYPNIINELIKVTSPKHRTQNDKINNPDLIIGILDRSFAYARIKNASALEVEHIEKSVRQCSRIYESAKEAFYRNMGCQETISTGKGNPYIKIWK